MAFHFSLEAVHQLRLIQERGERLKLESIATELALTHNRIIQLQQTMIQTRTELQRRMNAQISGSELHFESARVAGLVARRESLEAQVRGLEQRRAIQLQVFLKARQNQEVLSSLKQQMLERYRVDELRREQQQLDDLFLMRNFNSSLVEEPANEKPKKRKGSSKKKTPPDSL